MSIVATVAVEHMTTVNAALQAQGFGPRNFSVPAYGAVGATHAALHCWDSSDFLAALEAIPQVTVVEGIGESRAMTVGIVKAVGAQWGDDVPELPGEGMVTAGELYRFGTEGLWGIIQSFSRSIYNAHPSTYPALIRRVRNPLVREPWSQPIDQYDAYKLINPFTGQPSECTHNGQDWYVSAADGSGNNVWEPGVFGWTPIGEEAPANPGDPPGSETWVDTGATVTGQAGQLYYISQPITNLGLVAGQSIKLGDSETTYVSTWPGTDNLMQISPFVAVAVGTKVWRWG